MRREKIYSYIFFVLTIILVIGLIALAAYVYFAKPFSNENHTSSDYYENFKEMKKDNTEGEDYQIDHQNADSDILITAIHGGGIEPGTTELAKVTADKGEYNMYTFRGLLKEHNSRLHVTSTEFNEPRLIRMIKRSKVVVSLHGMDSDESVVYMGGEDATLKKSIREELENANFTVKKAPKALEGESHLNITNKYESSNGVQLEISEGLRREFFKDDELTRASRENPDNYSEAMEDFSAALIRGLKTAE
ncbi:hypothetical protein JCM2421_05080 [Staphylococcus auricularis]|nr:poly-gamma-glutamate hydrolase family protein [Staphylococcus auricularis]QPT05783.1 poly-gamma-glutamate hydrolase family protein [Staphylococcus auricularis]BCU51736.1 hypothetical protein JCM2421_05080 [Staphylococcus auricularis]SQJ07451.1 Phage-related replication protein [Staphylococcus auricularis]